MPIPLLMTELDSDTISQCTTTMFNEKEDDDVECEEKEENLDDDQSVGNGSGDQTPTSLQVSLHPDWIEDRFRVDRRKLEQMILAINDVDKENAEEFFSMVMRETSTEIAWPSKLKIGARSKKDPYVKVNGLKENVAAAKEKIMTVLDTKSHRVTLKMEVSHTDHSHIIGKGGSHIKQVMLETDCHIHFPDSNRTGIIEKSNQVSVSGSISAVESARIKIRNLLPLVLLFELPYSSSISSTCPDSSSPAIQRIQQRHNVMVVVRQHRHVFVRTVIVRGSVYNASSVKEATLSLFELMTGRTNASFSVSLLVDIAPLHHMLVIGQSGTNIRQIMQRTETTIHFPDPATVVPNRRSTVYITGAIDNVLVARQQLLGCLPLVLMYDMQDETVKYERVNQMMEQLNVSISIKLKPKQMQKSVVIKSLERNAANIYEARRQIIEAASSEFESPSSGVMSPASKPLVSLADPMCYMNHKYLPQMNLNHHVMMQGAIRSVLAPTAIVPLTLSHVPVYQPVTMIPQYHPNYRLPPAVINNHLAIPRANSFSGAADPGFPGVQKCNSFSGSLEMGGIAVPRTSSDGGSGDLGCCTSPRTPQYISPLSASAVEERTHNQDEVSHASQNPSLSNNNFHFNPEQQETTLESLTKLVNSLGSMSVNNPAALSSDNSIDASRASSDADMLYRLLLQTAAMDAIAVSNSLQSNSYSDLASTAQQNQNHLDLFKASIMSPNLPLPNEFSSCATPEMSFPQSESGGSNLFDTSNIMASLGAACRQESSLTDNPVADAAEVERDRTAAGVSKFFLPCLDPKTMIETSQPLLCHQLGQLGRSSQTDLSELEDARSLMTWKSVNELHGNHEPSKAPGFSRPKKQFQQFYMENPLSNDYEQKKLLANKAMQGKPMGEERTPTDFWSGLGFSRSMPDSAIRAKLTQNNVRFQENRMATTLEVSEPEADVDSHTHAWSCSPNMAAHNVTSSMTEDECLAAQLMTAMNAAPLFAEPKPSAGNSFEDSPSDSVGEMASIWQSDGGSVPRGAVDFARPAADNMMSPKDLAELFSQLGLSKYTDLFQQQEIDLATFHTLTEQDLKELGITTFGARRKMLLAIADLGKRRLVVPPPPGLPNPFKDASVVRRPDFSSQSGRW